MQRINIFILIAVVTVTLFSCDYIREPYTVPGPNGCTVPEPDFVPNPNPVRKVMIDEFTGHYCGNCPSAHQVVDQMLSNGNNAERVFVVAHHSEYALDFTKPWAPNPENKFIYDFRNKISSQLDYKYNGSAYPSGMVNRKKYSGNEIVPYASWESYATDLLSTPPVLDIQLKNFYDPTGKTICSYYYVQALENITGDYSIVIYLTEDSIIQWQKNVQTIPMEIENYTHKHVLRTSFNGYFGTAINEDGGLSAGETFINGFSISLDNTDWNPDHLNVVAYVYNVASNEIIQAEGIKLIP
jgi:hypothetical protein